MTQSRCLFQAALCPLVLVFATSAAAQYDLPELRCTPALIMRGDGGSIRLVVPRPVTDTRTQSYTVQVPHSVTVQVGGRTVTKEEMHSETRERTVSVTVMASEEIEAPAGQFEVRRASGEPVRILSSGAQRSRTVPVLLVAADDPSRTRLPLFFDKLLRPEAIVVFVTPNVFDGVAANGGMANRGANPIIPTRPPVPPAPAQVNRLTVKVNNQSGKTVEIFYIDAQHDREVMVNPSVANRQRLAPLTTHEGVRWIAKIDGRMVSEFSVGSDPESEWLIGPPLQFTRWEGSVTQLFEMIDATTWAHYGPKGRLLGKLREEERTDAWVAMYDGGRDLWIRLMPHEAIYDGPQSDGWQKLCKRADGDQTNASGDGSGLTKHEIDKLLSIHNQARAQVGVPPVTWSDGMAEYAQRWADKLAKENRFDHRQNSPYGENLAIARTARDAAGMWYGEKNRYNGQTMDGRNFMTFGHYTQMVWRNSTRIGCGKATVNGRTIWVCNYDPPGNMIGSKPY